MTSRTSSLPVRLRRLLPREGAMSPGIKVDNECLKSVAEVCLPNFVIRAPPTPTTREATRTRAEMADFLPLSALTTSLSPVPKTRRRKRTRAEMVAAASNSIGKIIVRKRRRTRAEMAAAAIGNVAVAPLQVITYQRRCTQNELGTAPHVRLPLPRTLRSSTLPKTRRTCFERLTDSYGPPLSTNRTLLKGVGCSANIHLIVKIGSADSVCKLQLHCN